MFQDFKILRRAAGSLTKLERRNHVTVEEISETNRSFSVRPKSRFETFAELKIRDTGKLQQPRFPRLNRFRAKFVKSKARYFKWKALQSSWNEDCLRGTDENRI